MTWKTREFDRLVAFHNLVLHIYLIIHEAAVASISGRRKKRNTVRTPPLPPVEFCIKKLNVCRSNFTKQRHEDWRVCIEKVLQFHGKKKSDFFRELKYHNLFIFVSISSSISSFCVLLACNRRQDILSTQILNNKSKSHQIIFQKLANRQLRSKQLINKTKGIQKIFTARWKKVVPT